MISTTDFRVTHTRLDDELCRELVRRGLISPDQVVEAIRLRKQEDVPLPEFLVSRGLVAADDLRAALGNVLNVPVVDLKRQKIDPRVLTHLSETLVRRHRALPIEMRGNVLLVAMANPENLQALEDLKAHASIRLQAALADPDEIDEAIDLYYKATSEISKFLGDFGRPALAAGAAALQTETPLAETPVARTLDLLLTQAVRDRASDVHIEPQPDRLRIRFRIDGVLQETVSLPLAIHAPLVSRIKVLGQMNIAERRLPQDGQFTFKAEGREVDVRVATIETSNGERAVIRVLDKTTSLMSLPELGFLPESLQRYLAMLRTPHGIILVSGPTGSGKTTTLYASINSLDRKGRNIVTIEDPVEYHFSDVNQIQVNLKAGLTFSSGLRALMRHDPDVILVGEIRDKDTAQTAVQASLTGHLVLSSVHANDTGSVVYRLTNLGIEPFLITSSLVGVVAQRMIRKVCPNCSTRRDASPEERLVYERVMGEPAPQFAYGAGCQFCAATGYRGRTGVFEILLMTESLRSLVLANADPSTLAQQAVKEGMVAILSDGLMKAKLGITNPAEVLRNLYTAG